MDEEATNSAEEVRAADQNRKSVEAMIESSIDFGATESTCNHNITSAESSVVTSEGECEQSLEYADELMARGFAADKESDYSEATDCYSRALEIRVAHFGAECVTAYYKYGCALLYKAQDEADPLGAMPKKEGISNEDSKYDGSEMSAVKGGSSTASISNNTEQDGNKNCSDEAPDKTVEGKDDGEEESDTEELADGDENESGLDLAWKMLDVARAIIEKQSAQSSEKIVRSSSSTAQSGESLADKEAEIEIEKKIKRHRIRWIR